MADMIHALLETVYEGWFSTMMRDSLWAYPIAEALHHFGIALLFGSIVLADLRFIGVGRAIPVEALTSGFLLRITWIGFAINLMAGLALFSAYAPDTINSPIFRTKMLLIAAAGANMLFFSFRVSRGMSDWGVNATPPPAARISAALSILLWTATIFAGRLIAYPEMFEAAS